VSTWTRIDDADGFVYASLVDGDLVRVDFGDSEPDGGALTDVVAAVRGVARMLSGDHVRQIAIGASGVFSTDAIYAFRGGPIDGSD
jgi:hypothetical protein